MPQRCTTVSRIPPTKTHSTHSCNTHSYNVHAYTYNTYIHIYAYTIYYIQYIHCIQCHIGALTYEARLVCVCARCLDFFFMTHTPCLCGTISHNSTHYTYLAHTYIHIVGYAYTYLVYTHTHISTHKPIHTHTHLYTCV